VLKKFREVLWGVGFLFIGIILLFNVLEITNIDLFFDGWWTLFIIIPCFIGLFTEDYFGNMVGFLIGMALLSVCQGWIRFGSIVKLIFPISFVLIGIYILLHTILQNKVTEKFKKLKVDGESIVAIFGGQNLKLEEEYLGGDVEAIFGSVDLDLRDTKLKEETPIKVCAIFGGVTILVPKDVKVITKSVPIFGGVDSRVHSSETAKKTIYVEAVSIFGGVEIK